MVYHVTRTFPKEELYSVTSQLRRAAMSVMLNYVEGYARFKKGLKLQFYETSYGSLKNLGILFFFSQTEDYVGVDAFRDLDGRADEIGRMLWSEIEPLQNN